MKSSQPARYIYNLQPDLLGSFSADVFPASLGVVKKQNLALH